MRAFQWLTGFLCVAALAACEKGEPDRQATPSTAKATASATSTAKAAAQLAPGKFHFDFPVVEKTDAQKDDKVFFVNMELIRNALEKGEQPGGTQFLLGKMVAPGDKESRVRSATEYSVPNAGIVRIPPGQTAKVGDIVAGKWAVNLTRGYVTDASNPKSPKAVFIGLSYDNPAKADDKTTGIGQYEYTLAENEFMVISQPYDTGSACVYKEKGKAKLFEVWRAEGDMVLGKLFTTFTAVKKSECKPIPLKPDYKVGDEVYAPFVSSMSKAKITKIDRGRFGVIFETGSKEEKMISFGEVIDKID